MFFSDRTKMWFGIYDETSIWGHLSPKQGVLTNIRMVICMHPPVAF